MNIRTVSATVFAALLAVMCLANGEELATIAGVADAKETLTQAARDLRRRRRRRRRVNAAAAVCYDYEADSEANKFSQADLDIYFPGHKKPEAQTSGALAVCSTMTESQCREMFGCAYLNGVCIDTTDNTHCGQYLSENPCENDAAEACYWNKADGECQLRYQDCSQLDPEKCVEVDGCMWYNNLYRGHKAKKPSIASVSRGRCMADPCFRINNGKCTIQHTGGRCVWYTRSQNSARSGGRFDYPGCYVSPCNNRFNRKDCLGQNDPNNVYQCVWCGKVGRKLLGCQNAEPTSSAQCWNINDKDRGRPIPQSSNSNCKNCLGGLTSDGTCKGVPSKCATACCQSPYCHMFGESGNVGVQQDSGLDILG